MPPTTLDTAQDLVYNDTVSGVINMKPHATYPPRRPGGRARRACSCARCPRRPNGRARRAGAGARHPPRFVARARLACAVARRPLGSAAGCARSSRSRRAFGRGQSTAYLGAKTVPTHPKDLVYKDKIQCMMMTLYAT